MTHSVGVGIGGNISPIVGAQVGAIATAISQFLTTPLDVVRNRLMVRDKKRMKDATTKTNSNSIVLTNHNDDDDDNDDDNNKNINSNTSGYMQSLITLGKEEGWKGLFAGAIPRVGKALLSGAVQFATYEVRELCCCFLPLSLSCFFVSVSCFGLGSFLEQRR
jgi:solute carrier family 25 S-adenosylmethionine transporter 26